jgi:hypothetical protein
MIAFENNTWMYYIEKLNSGEYPTDRKHLSVKHDFKCVKQPLGCLNCGYYMCEHIRTCGQYIVNREDVSHYCFMYLYFISAFFHCLLTSFLLHQFSNYWMEWEYPFTKDMQNGGVDNVISDICMSLRCEIFHVEGAFFNKNGTLAKFSQLCTYERFFI